ncbi:hypothetical protein JCM10213_006508 [Rhodosporidiobolus nylandii]
MLASLAGGASCGPSNPLQQLSKTYGADRGVAQDHFGAGEQAGPSASSRSLLRLLEADLWLAQSFRQHPSSSATGHLPQDPSAQHFFQPQPGPSSQPFDLSPLNRALAPSDTAASTAAAPHAWAVAFQQQPQQTTAGSAQEHELFARAFGGARPMEQQAWRSEFSQQSHAAVSPAFQQDSVQHAAHLPAQATRLYGQGLGGPRPMMHSRPIGFAPQPVVQEKREGEVVQARQDWETAFLAQEAVTSSLPDVETAAVSFDSIKETRALTPPLRSHSPLADHVARDALAQTAANLLTAVQQTEEQRLQGSTSASRQPQLDVGAKFAQSSFMSLMRQLRDGEVAVEGDRVVDQAVPYSTLTAKGKARADGWASDFAATLQQQQREEEGRVGSTAPPLFRPGHGVEQVAKAQHEWADRQARDAQVVRELQEGYTMLEGLWDDEDRVRAAREKGKGKDRDAEANTHVPLAQYGWEEDLEDPSFISGGHAPGLATRTFAHAPAASAQQQEWDLLQRSWDEFEVTATGLQPKNAEASTSSTLHGYSFAQNNPYLTQHAATRHHAFHDTGALSSALLERHDSLLQHEATVQENPTSAEAWLALGLKQQQNEREDLAIAALRRAVELDSSAANGAAHLALAVSYTNEGRRFEAYEEIDRWVGALAQSGNRAYANEIDQYRNLLGTQLPRQTRERHEYLSGLLIRLAQSGAETLGGVDADVQVALGVLFNSSEEFEKASDCFEAALSVRPNDPLLFNRLGATYANSGKTDLAMQYYGAALDIDPGYVRARFNLAVANMNTGNYEEAVQHLLTSLSIQEADSQQDHLEQAPVADASGGVTSHTLWDSLNVSLLQMHRSDLAVLASQRDLKELMRAFPSYA